MEGSGPPGLRDLDPLESGSKGGGAGGCDCCLSEQGLRPGFVGPVVMSALIPLRASRAPAGRSTLFQHHEHHPWVSTPVHQAPSPHPSIHTHRWHLQQPRAGHSEACELPPSHCQSDRPEFKSRCQPSAVVRPQQKTSPLQALVPPL